MSKEEEDWLSSLPPSAWNQPLLWDHPRNPRFMNKNENRTAAEYTAEKIKKGKEVKQDPEWTRKKKTRKNKVLVESGKQWLLTYRKYNVTAKEALEIVLNKFRDDAISGIVISRPYYVMYIGVYLYEDFLPEEHKFWDLNDKTSGVYELIKNKARTNLLIDRIDEERILWGVIPPSDPKPSKKRGRRVSTELLWKNITIEDFFHYFVLSNVFVVSTQ